MTLKKPKPSPATLARRSRMQRERALKLPATPRRVRTRLPLCALPRTWTGLEFDFGLDTRKVPKSAGLDVQQAGHRLKFVLNRNARRVKQLLEYLDDTGTWNDAEELAGCRRVLEAWSEEVDPDQILPAHWQPLERYFCEEFPGILVEPDDPLGLEAEEIAHSVWRGFP